jgi:hypothetical protein
MVFGSELGERIKAKVTFAISDERRPRFVPMGDGQMDSANPLRTVEKECSPGDSASDLVDAKIPLLVV